MAQPRRTIADQPPTLIDTGDIDEELRELQTNFNQRSPQPSKSGNDDSSVCDMNYRLSTDLKGGPTELQACISLTAVWEGHARSWLE